MDTSEARPGRWISYTSGPGGKSHLPPDDRSWVERQEQLRAQHRGHLLCEVHVQVYDHDGKPYVSFPDGAALGPDSDAAEIAAAVARARDCLAYWR